MDSIIKIDDLENKDEEELIEIIKGLKSSMTYMITEIEEELSNYWMWEEC